MSAESVTMTGVQDPSCKFSPETEAFLAKIESGIGIEALILQDTHAQRRAGRLLRKSQKEQQHELLKEAVRQMKKAADKRLTSAVTGALLETGAGLFESFLGGPLGKWLGSQAWSKCITKGVNALAGGFSKYNPWDAQAVNLDGKAKLLEESSRAMGESASETSRWINSARELENRMVDHLAATLDREHQIRQKAIGTN